MNLRFFAGIFIALTLCTCRYSNEKTPVKKKIVKANSSLVGKASAPAANPKKLIPVNGYRFTITGNFDGRSKTEKLTEHFFSGINHKETNKFYDSLDYDSLVALTEKKKPYSFVSCNNKRIANLKISSDPQLLGLAFLKNEGDLNGDGTDEISYVVDWADWSNLNTCYIMPYRNGKWEHLYSFPIWDWQLPDMPETYNDYGFAGLQNKINIKDAVADKKIEDNFNAFKGLIKKVANNKIKIVFMNDRSELDSTVVDLRKHHKKNHLG